MKQTTLILLIAFVAAMLLPAVAHACPSCAEAMSNDPTGSNPAEGFFWSILAMMAMPFLLAGGFGTAVYLHTKKSATDITP